MENGGIKSKLSNQLKVRGKVMSDVAIVKQTLCRAKGMSFCPYEVKPLQLTKSVDLLLKTNGLKKAS